MWQKKRINELHNRQINRKRLKSQIDELRFIKENVLIKIIVKQQKKEIIEKKRIENNFMKM